MAAVPAGLPKWPSALIRLLLIQSLCVLMVHAQVLNPPYFNIAEGRKIYASSTCGEKFGEPELYCNLMSSNNFDHKNRQSDTLILGQHCNFCDPNNPEQSRKSDYITDGTSRFWQSPPISRGLEYALVNLTLDLDQEFHIAYLMLKTGNSPRPKIWALERSTDNGKTWKPWQYFAPNREECELHFTNFSMRPITRDDQVICETAFSKFAPLENAEITVRLISDRPSSENFEESPVLQEWTKATNIRLRLLQPFTAGSIKADSTTTRRFFYSFRDMQVGGRCVCNGHATTCNLDPNEPKKLQCQCVHNTCGPQCETCCPGFVQKKWKPASPGDPHTCERCNCNEHSEDCYYDAEIDRKGLSMDLAGNYSGGGVCRNCRHNTQGINCEKCVDGYYKQKDVDIKSEKLCAKCACNEHFHSGRCKDYTGRCECRSNFAGEYCDRCAEGFYAYPTCKPCECFVNGTRNHQCELPELSNTNNELIESEEPKENLNEIIPSLPACDCLSNFSGARCRQCAAGYFNFSSCTACNCEKPGSQSDACDSTTGQCICRNSFGGRRCEHCDVGYFHYPDCEMCNCERVGTLDSVCDQKTGVCHCKEGYMGDRCEQCVAGYFGYPNCKLCECNETGSLTPLCTSTGKCACMSNFDGLKCNKCKPGYYSKDGNCVACGCDPNGRMGVSCNAQGKCTCLENFEGDKCDQCRRDYYNYPACERCDCNPNGVSDTFAGCDVYSAATGGVSSASQAAIKNNTFASTRLCECKARVTGRKCNRCKSLYWNLNKSNPSGCQECQCSTQGTLSALAACGPVSGKCECKTNVAGRICNTCRDGFFRLEAAKHFGCEECDCSPGGAEHGICSKENGLCRCRPRIAGQKCDQPMKKHYVPTLYQYKYELEDAQNTQASAARYAYNESQFPEFSWKGYAVFSDLQPQLQWNIRVDHLSLYRVVIVYVNPNPETVTGLLTFTPINGHSNPESQSIPINFETTGEANPKKLLVLGKVGTQSVIHLRNGNWSVNLQVNGPLLADYLVLLPEHYWSPPILKEHAQKPCELLQAPEVGDHCKQYSYPEFKSDVITLNGQMLTSDNAKVPDDSPLWNLREFFDIKVDSSVPWIHSPETKNNYQELIYEFVAKEEGKHVVLLDHHSIDLKQHNEFIKLSVKLVPNFNITEKPQLVENSSRVYNLRLESDQIQPLDEHSLSTFKENSAILTHCNYSFVCRTLVKNSLDDVAVIYLQKDAPYKLIILQTEGLENAALLNVHFMPVKDYTLDYVRGEVACLRNSNGACATSRFAFTPQSQNMQIYENPQERLSDSLSIPIGLQPSNLSEYTIIQGDQLQNIAFGNVSNAKLYSLLIHYYQPLHGAFSAESSIQLANGNVYVGRLPLNFCPNIAGCRAQLLTGTSGILFELSESFDLALKLPEKHSLFIRSILIVSNNHLVPASLQPPTLLGPSVDFISTCAADAYYISATNASTYCRRAVFELAVTFNKEALFCNCDRKGSESHDCAPFGGQCHCKANIIGRTCNACRTGYYGFPNCRPCNCPSTAYCEPTTGKCVCPPRVTGARCDQCVQFTYGYHPLIGCEECNCNSLGIAENKLQCELTTGECHCRKNIAGRRCDRCASGFYRFHQCLLCQCHSPGSTQEVCDANNGRCFCKPHVLGPRCDTCRPDSYNLEESNSLGCTKCWCSGVSQTCKPSRLWYALLEQMPGDVASADEWSLVRLRFAGSDHQLSIDKIASNVTYTNSTEQQLVKLNNFISPDENIFTEDSEKLDKLKIDGNSIIFGARQIHAFISKEELEESKSNESQYGFYVRLPSVYSGSKLNSYGGVLSYRVWHATYENNGVYSAPDVLLQAKNFVVLHEQQTQPIEPSIPHLVSVELLERNFKHLDGRAVSREEFMYLLLNITHVHVKASYFKYTNHVRISQVRIQVAVDPQNEKVDDRLLANRVEHCSCPEGYQGGSCEQCAPGFYRAKAGPSKGFCIPCECNGHSFDCDVNTGICRNCLHHTTGDYCEMCSAGYHGNATIGMPDDCLICACPLPIEQNNFASSCSIDNFRAYRAALTGLKSLQDGTNGNRYNYQIQCDCSTGYTGATCEHCATGYYGQPALQGGLCSRCDCNGNANLEKPGSCDSTTGLCLLCGNNTYGEHCERCAPGFYGDAIEMKNCSPCSCAKCGSSQCDHKIGTCVCKRNIVGAACDRCADDHWGYSKCAGCEPCECGVASIKTQCAMDSGQCECQPGAAGMRCETCAPGYWNYTVSGCISCNCSERFSIGTGCDQATGQCKCLPGVIGERCDRCPNRWVFIEGVGCRPCENCVHSLLDETDSLDNQLVTALDQLNSSSSELLAERRLIRVNDTLVRLKIQLGKLISASYDNFGTETALNTLDVLKHAQKQMVVLQEQADKVNDQQALLSSAAMRFINEASLTNSNATVTFEQVNQLRDRLWKQIEWISSLRLILGDETRASGHEDSLLIKADRILSQMKSNNKNNESEIVHHKKEADALFNQIEHFRQPLIKFEKHVNNVSASLSRFEKLVMDLSGWTAEAEKMSIRFEQSNVSLQSIYRETVQNIEKTTELREEVKKSQQESNTLLSNALSFVLNHDNIINQLNVSSRLLEKSIERLQSRRVEWTAELEDLEGLVVRANVHAVSLAEKAEKVKEKFNDKAPNTENAVAAANAYEEIVVALKTAQDHIDSSKSLMNELDKIVKKNGQNAKAKAFDLRNLALQGETKVSNELGRRINESEILLTSLNSSALQKLNKLKTITSQLQGGFTNEMAIELKVNGEKATKIGEKCLQMLGPLEEHLIKRVLALETMHQSEKTMRDAQDQLRNANRSAHSYAERLDQLVPDLDIRLNNVSQSQLWAHKKQSTLVGQLGEVKRQVRSARATVNRITLGIHFEGDSYAQLRVPRSLLKSGTYTKLELQFRAQASNGLLAYLGSPRSARDGATAGVSGIMLFETPRQKNTGALGDYIAVELREWLPVLIVHVGGGEPLTLMYDFKVMRNVWQKLTIELIGKHVSLTIKSADGVDRSISTHIGGTYSVFNLQPSSSHFYLGGVPKQIELQEQVSATSFSGDIQHVRLGGEQLGVWNFVRASGNRTGVDGKALSAAGGDNALKFNGKAYAIVKRDARQFIRETNVLFWFRTLAEEALLLLLHGEQDYLSVQLRNGQLHVLVELGSGQGQMSSKNKLNNNAWHRLDLSRGDREVIVKVDGETVGDFKTGGNEAFLDVQEKVYFGGYPPNGEVNTKRLFEHSVITTPLLGCLKDIYFGNTLQRLDKQNDAELSPGVEISCSESVIRELRFNQPNGFTSMRMDRPVSQLSMKFRTNSANGLLFFASNSENKLQMALALQAGLLVWMTGSGDVVRSQGPLDVKFNDSRWHYLIATRTDRIMRLDVDDRHVYQPQKTSNSHQGFPLLTASNDSLVYFGGAPENLSSALNEWNLPTDFIGCLGDVNLNEGFQNFVHAVTKQGVQFSACSGKEIEDPLPTKTQKAVTENTFSVSSTLSSKVTTSKPDEEVTMAERLSIPITTAETSTLSYSEPQHGCALPIKPSEMFQIKGQPALRFGLSEHAHLQIPLTDLELSEFERGSNFELSFKTNGLGNGILMFIADEKYMDYMILFMLEGKVHFSFNCGSGPATIISDNTFNDGNWHTVQFGRNEQNGTLNVDGVTNVAFSPGNASMLNLRSPLYLGGVPLEIGQQVVIKTKDVKGSFNGCIRDFKIQESSVNRIEDGKSQGIVVGCDIEGTEEGTYFTGQGYVMTKEPFRVQNKLRITLEIKARNSSGLILYAGSTKEVDHLMLEHKEGRLRLSVDNGNGPFVAEIKKDSKWIDICDGKWHKMEILKMDRLIVLVFDSHDSGPHMQFTSKQSSADTNTPLYIGGHPIGFQEVGAVWKSSSPYPGNFAGCIRNLRFESKVQKNYNNYSLTSYSENIYMGEVSKTICPV